MYDSWGSSWGAVSAWAQAWVHPTRLVVIDTHDDVDRINEYKRRREELYESILRAYEDVTGESRVPTVEDIQKEEKAKPLELRTLKRIKEDVLELKDVNESILRVSRMLQEKEMQDIAFIVSIL
jgi:hypothetical protein